jgi:hypothetical protein
MKPEDYYSIKQEDKKGNEDDATGSRLIWMSAHGELASFELVEDR